MMRQLAERSSGRPCDRMATLVKGTAALIVHSLIADRWTMSAHPIQSVCSRTSDARAERWSVGIDDRGEWNRAARVSEEPSNGQRIGRPLSHSTAQRTSSRSQQRRRRGDTRGVRLYRVEQSSGERRSIAITSGRHDATGGPQMDRGRQRSDTQSVAAAASHITRAHLLTPFPFPCRSPSYRIASTISVDHLTSPTSPAELSQHERTRRCRPPPARRLRDRPG